MLLLGCLFSTLYYINATMGTFKEGNLFDLQILKGVKKVHSAVHHIISNHLKRK